MSEQDKAKCGNIDSAPVENAAVSRQGAKGYHAYVTSLIEDKDSDTTFPSSNETKVASTVDDVAKDFEGPSYGAEKQGPTEIEKFPETAPFAKEHAVEANIEVKGQNSGSLPKFAKTDPVADKNKEVY
jgi:hypothetical protein